MEPIAVKPADLLCRLLTSGDRGLAELVRSSARKGHSSRPITVPDCSSLNKGRFSTCLIYRESWNLVGPGKDFGPRNTIERVVGQTNKKITDWSCLPGTPCCLKAMPSSSSTHERLVASKLLHVAGCRGRTFRKMILHKARETNPVPASVVHRTSALSLIGWLARGHSVATTDHPGIYAAQYWTSFPFLLDFPMKSPRRSAHGRSAPEADRSKAKWPSICNLGGVPLFPQKYDSATLPFVNRQCTGLLREFR